MHELICAGKEEGLVEMGRKEVERGREGGRKGAERGEGRCSDTEKE